MEDNKPKSVYQEAAEYAASFEHPPSLTISGRPLSTLDFNGSTNIGLSDAWVVELEAAIIRKVEAYLDARFPEGKKEV